MNKKLLNTYIKSVKKEDGPAIVKFYKEQGCDTRYFDESNCEEREGIYIYYGVDNTGDFDVKLFRELGIGVKILTLEEANTLVSEKQFPRVMLVSHDNNIITAKKRVVFMKKNNKYISWSYSENIEEAEEITDTVSWSYAWEVEEYKHSRFPFLLSTQNAKEIIDIACLSWKTSLAKRWGANIVLNQDNIIEEKDYLTMRNACTDIQNLKFDKIFGKD
jgi:hypothetical protein